MIVQSAITAVAEVVSYSLFWQERDTTTIIIIYSTIHPSVQCAVLSITGHLLSVQPTKCHRILEYYALEKKSVLILLAPPLGAISSVQRPMCASYFEKIAARLAAFNPWSVFSGAFFVYYPSYVV